MKKWTCSILSFVLLAVSALFPKLENGNDILQGAISFFLGVKSQNTSKEIYIDLEPQVLSDDMLLEINNINAMISKEEIKLQKAKSILIYHTHTDEAFLKGEQDYVETSTGRTKNQDYSIVKVGDTFKNSLINAGFTVVHDKTDNVKNGFYNAYDTSYQTIKQYIGKTDIYVDMHRDAYSGKEPNFITQNDKEYAYIAFVVANGENYIEKPNWQENYKLAKILSDKIDELCPGISKGIIFKDKRFNQHVSNSCILVEMGNERNTIEQVDLSAQILAKAFSEVLN